LYKYSCNSEMKRKGIALSSYLLGGHVNVKITH
jgi:hypothetical protein